MFHALLGVLEPVLPSSQATPAVRRAARIQKAMSTRTTWLPFWYPAALASKPSTGARSTVPSYKERETPKAYSGTGWLSQQVSAYNKRIMFLNARDRGQGAASYKDFQTQASENTF